ncbi:TetR/AcrR family transcriptional regulator [Paenibacillus sp. SN-8-1]|uniref:TetR/AcrR family transcriptional regulator n=1 Tax=Paenibacillus sp. SN-8-1 TaxID=3435409 RepID=UPI003D9A914B
MVQVQKPQIREALLKAAKHEFMEHGFQLSSTRRIAASAGTTIGNMYKYFQSKDELFEHLVSEVQVQLYSFIKEHEAGSNKTPRAHEQLQVFVNLMSDYRDEMLLLIDASEGTKYRSTYEELIAMVSLNLQEHLSDFNIPAVPDVEVLVRTIAVGLVSGWIDVLRNHSDKEDIKNGLTQYFLFVFRSFL